MDPWADSEEGECSGCDDKNVSRVFKLQAVFPPQNVLDRDPTVEDVSAYPWYFIVGPGRVVASRTLCDHNYYLTDSCPCCDSR